MLRLFILIRPFSKYLLIAWVLAIITVSSIPSIPALKIRTANADIRLDYLIHFLEYGILSFLAFLSFAGSKFKPGFRKYILITIGLILFAFLDEFHQKLIPGRTFNVKDILSNAVGIIAAVIFCIAAFRKIARNVGKTV